MGPYIRDDAPVEPVAAGLLTVSIAAVPLTAAVLTADGGRGGLVWTLVADAAGVMAVATDGALVATATLRSGSFATVSVAVADAAMLSRATMAGDDVFLCAAGVFAEFGELFGGAEFCRGGASFEADGGNRGLFVFVGGGGCEF